MREISLTKKLAEAGEGIFTGLASTDDLDRYGDVIVPSAYRKSIEAFNAGKLVLPILADHDRLRQIGSVIALEEVAGGLMVTAQLALGTDDGRLAFERMRAGRVGLSVGLGTVATDDRDGVRYITAADLAEISVVALPANPAAGTLTVTSRRDEEHELRRTLGLSANQAKAYAAAGRAALRNLPPDDEPLVAATAALASLSTFLRGEKR